MDPNSTATGNGNNNGNGDVTAAVWASKAGSERNAKATAVGVSANTVPPANEGVVTEDVHMNGDSGKATEVIKPMEDNVGSEQMESQVGDGKQEQGKEGQNTQNQGEGGKEQPCNEESPVSYPEPLFGGEGGDPWPNQVFHDCIRNRPICPVKQPIPKLSGYPLLLGQ